MNVKLPGFVVADLYKNTLVITGDIDITPVNQPVQVTEIEDLPKPENTGMAQKKWYLGDNKKGIAIIVSDENAAFINDEWLETLTKMLGGLQINLGDTAIVNLYNNPIGFNEIKQQLGTRYVILFGVTTTQLGLPFTIPYYQAQNYAGCTLLNAPVETLAGPQNTTDSIKAEKRKLWERLKGFNF